MTSHTTFLNTKSAIGPSTLTTLTAALTMPLLVIIVIMMMTLSMPTTAAASLPSTTTEVSLKPVLSDAKLLEAIGVRVLTRHEETGVGYAELTPQEEERLSAKAHEWGRCGGYEALPAGRVQPRSLALTQIFGELSAQEAKNRRFRPSSDRFETVIANPAIEAALSEVSEDNLKETVEFMSRFKTRYHKGANPNEAVLAVKSRIEGVLKDAKIPYQIDLVAHTSTQQKSIRVRLPGASRPQEVIVLGGHIDSINQDWFGDRGSAPGADDNASGSSNLIEALRVISSKAQPQRSIEFFWYAGEEGGLLGSSEIAKDYKSKRTDVVAVLQLDMTLFPGSGEFTLGSMTDYTSAWLRSYLESLNSVYVKARIVEDQCGYGCSDHASWHRQGFPAVMPFEATFNGMNHNLHTSKDVIDSRSNFRHSAMFSKITVAIAMDLGNSTLRETP